MSGKLAELFKGTIGSLKVKGSLTQNFAWTSSTKLAASVLSIIITPILTRIYSPGDYGLFSVFSIIITNYLALSSLGYSEAMMIVKSKREFFQLFWLSICLVVITTVLFYFAINTFLTELIDIDIEQITSLWPVVIFCMITWGFLVIFQKISIHLNNFRVSSQIGLSHVVSNKALAVLFGSFKISIGLIYAEFLSKGISLILHVVVYSKFLKLSLSQFSFPKLWKMLVLYRNYPIYVLSSKYLKTIGGQLPLVVIPYFFDLETLGHFALVVGLVNIPIRLFGYSMSTVFLRKIRDLETVETFSISQRIFRTVSILLIPIFFLALSAKYWFPFLLGEKWVIAAELAPFMIMVVVHLILESIYDGVFQLKRKEKRLFVLDTIFVITLAVTLILLGQYGVSIELMILTNSLLLICFAFIKVQMVYHILSSSVSKSNIYLFVLATGLLALLYYLS